MGLKKAFNELRLEILNGQSLIDVVDDIGAEYGVHPALLTRLFLDSYGSEEAFRVQHAHTDPVLKAAALVEHNVAACCKEFGVERESTRVVRCSGAVYTLICRVEGETRWPYRVVRHSDGARLMLGRYVRLEPVK